MTPIVNIFIFQHVSLAHLQIVMPSTFQTQCISRVFFEVTSIYLHQAHSFVTMFAPDHRRGWRGKNHILTAHTLEEIDLEEVLFAVVCIPYEESEIYMCNPTFQCLCDALTHRRHTGYSLRRITISDNFYVGTDLNRWISCGLFAR